MTNEQESHPSKYTMAQEGQVTEELHMDLKVFRARLTISDVMEIYYPDIAIAFAGGKNSTTLATLTRELYPDVPLKFFFCNTQRQFPETYEFIKQAMEYFAPVELLEIKVAQRPETCDKCQQWKTWAAREGPIQFGLRSMLVAIRQTDSEARSEADWGRMVNGVWRVHPLLAWTEENIWDFLDDRGVPTNPLYKQGYRSLGCMPPCTQKSSGEGERSGRNQTKEAQMVKLRGEGYW